MTYTTHYGAPLPEGFVAQMQQMLGPDAEAFFGAMQAEPRTAVRYNPAKPAARLAGDAVAWCAEGVLPFERPRFTLMPALHGGAFYVQEAASMVAGQWVRRLSGGRPMRILDLCAAPGGKSTAIAAAMPAGSVLVANEVVRQRAAILRENLMKWGHPDVIVTSAPADVLGRLEGVFDLILVDAPCSGEGMMRKDPDALQQWSAGLVERCAALQREILTGIMPALRPGGVLMFGTCTYNRVENDGSIALLAEEYGMEPVAAPDLPIRFMPHLYPSEGLFMQPMRLPGEEPARRLRAPKPPKQRIEVPNVIRNQADYAPISDPRGTISLLRREHLPLHAALEKEGVRILSAGIEAGSVKGRDFVPSPALALSTELLPDAFPAADADLPTALEYLRRNPITVDAPKGWVVVRHEGLPLGFVKNLGTRSNNHWPDAWRIRTL